MKRLCATVLIMERTSSGPYSLRTMLSPYLTTGSSMRAAAMSDRNLLFGPHLHPHKGRRRGNSVGLQLISRWADWTGTPFEADSSQHVSVYGRR